MIKYIGSKRRLLPRIVEIVDGLPGVETVLDLFSGTSRVGWALKERGYRVVANDHNAYAWVLARCYVQADATHVLPAARRLVSALARTPAKAGWFTRTFCEEARFFHPRNGALVEGARERLASWRLAPDLEAVLLTSLLEAADRVDSTTGVQMAYLKQWAPRALKPLEFRVPALLPGGGTAICADAAEAARQGADLAYLDPPYNQHSYRANYHVWETLVRWDEPEAYGVARKRMDCRTTKSRFNSKRAIVDALRAVLDALTTRYVLVSFNDEGFIDRETMEALLGTLGPVRVFESEHPRYVGARIGIHNPQGQRVGRVGRLRNREYLYLVERDARAPRLAEG